MAHTKEKDLNDLAIELGLIRKLEGLREKGPGIFYFKGKPFLHFHDKNQIRWAHIKVEGSWLELKIDFLATKKEKEIFLKRVFEIHKAGMK